MVLEIFEPSFIVMYPYTGLSVFGVSSEGGLSITQKYPKFEVLPLHVLYFLSKLVNAF
jgi:hypothetical protein